MKKHFKFNSLLSLSFFYFCNLLAYGNSCPDVSRLVVEKFSDFNIEYIHLERADGKPIADIRDLQTFAGERADGLFLGIDKEVGHFYLMLNGRRVDAYGAPPFLRIRVREKASYHPLDGLLIKFSDFSPSEVAGFMNELAGRFDGAWGATCVNASCGILQSIGVDIGGVTKAFLPTRAMDRIFSQGFFDSQGRPLKIEIYRIGSPTGYLNEPQTIAQLRKHFRSSELEFAEAAGFKAAMLSLASGTLYILLSRTVLADDD